MTTTPEKPDDVRPTEAPLDAAREQREYGHSSGDRNTKSEEGDWKSLEGGQQRKPSDDPDELVPDGDSSGRKPSPGT